MTLSSQQEEVVAAGLGPLAVMACAGSGKTRTAVHRLLEVRRRLGPAGGRVALLSFSNIAVDTFRSDFAELCDAKAISFGGGVEIDTIDGFITNHILRPHAYRIMKARQAAFLVSGSEPFLKGFTLPALQKGGPPISVGDIHVKIENRRFEFFVDVYGNQVALDGGEARELVEKLGTIGAYTHELGRFWCCKALVAEPKLLKAFAHRYPEILVDEAQDIGSAQQAILNALAKVGSSVTLIGDPHQGIYGYAGADGAYMRNHSPKPYLLTRNYRSIPSITKIARALSGDQGDTARPEPGPPAGAYAVPYAEDDYRTLIARYRQAIDDCGLDVTRSAVLCRAKTLVDTISGGATSVGAGAVRLLARASALRDARGELHKSFRLVAEALEQSLLDKPPDNLVSHLCDPYRHPEVRQLRRLVWAFVRSTSHGLPAAHLPAKTHWLMALRTAMKALLTDIQDQTGLAPAPNFAQRLTAKALPDGPVSSLKAEGTKPLRIDTVHGAKGETLDAALYIVTKDHLKALLGGTTTEVGRIGYVAVTRPRDLLWLGVPASAFAATQAALIALGFSLVPPPATTATSALTPIG